MRLTSLLRGLVVVLLALTASGCVRVQPTPSTASELEQELKAHVAFLCQPELKGRKTGTRGARVAAKYIGSRYAALGLLPWGAEKSYTQSFAYGRNVVGVLPGSDPAFKDEIVLVCAHYDHLGKTAGKVHPGAADNAAGVAALLETARALASSGQRPKRSIAFAAFDSEEQMLFGSFAFSLREDVRQAGIVAVVNMDILGRAFMDVAPNTLFVAGTEDYPSLRTQVKETAAAAGIRVLPLGTDLIGPRSDHVAFELREVPCLFFTSGTCRDYHQPTDTPEKLRYDDIERSTRVITSTVRRLADGSLAAADRTAPTETFFQEELQTVKTMMAEVNAHPEVAGVKGQDAAAFASLEQRAQVLLERGKYDKQARTLLISEATGILAPYFLAFDDVSRKMAPQEREDLAGGLRIFQLFYLLHKEQVLNAYAVLVAQVLKDRPSAFRSMRRMDYRLYLIDDEDICVASRPDGTYSLDGMGNWLNLTAGSRPTKLFFKGFTGSVSIGFDGIHCAGTGEELEDFCLLRLRHEQGDQPAASQVQKLLSAVHAPSAGKPWVSAIADRLRRGNFGDEPAWLASCIVSGNPHLTLSALNAGAQHPRITSAMCQVITNQQVRGDIRAAAIRAAVKDPDPTVLLALRAVVGDRSPAVSGEKDPVLGKDYPFADRAWIQALRPFIERLQAKDPKSPATIGGLAREHLSRLTKQYPHIK